MYGPSYLTLLPRAYESVILQFDKIHMSRRCTLTYTLVSGVKWRDQYREKKENPKTNPMQNRLIKQYKVQSCWFNTALPILAHPDVTQGPDVGIKFVFFLLRPGHGHQPNVWIFKYSSQIYQNKYDSNG